jgi:hypothetical protein
MTANDKKESMSEGDKRSNDIPFLLKAAWIIGPGAQILLRRRRFQQNSVMSCLGPRYFFSIGLRLSPEPRFTLSE